MRSAGPYAGRVAVALALLAPLIHAQEATSAPPPDAAGQSAAATPLSKEQISYLFGLEFGEQMHRVGITDQVTLDDMKRGVQDGLNGKTASTEDQQQVQEFARAQLMVRITANKKAGRDFLEHNSHEKGIKTTASGLQYRVLAAGNAKAAAVTPEDEVTVQYRGKLIDGTEFDSSYTHGAPATFRANAVIQGWQEALLLMKPGAKYQLFIPTELGYNDRGNPGIPPGSALIFDVELVSVKSASAAALPSATPPTRHMQPAPQSPQSK